MCPQVHIITTTWPLLWFPADNLRAKPHRQTRCIKPVNQQTCQSWGRLETTLSHPLLLANLYMGTWRRGGGGIRRSHFVVMAHLKAELWLVRWYQNKHGGPNESNKAFENKCYLLYEINIFRINNSRVRKVIHGWLSAWPAGSHRLVSWKPGDSPAGSAGPADNQPWIPLHTRARTITWLIGYDYITDCNRFWNS